MICTKNVFTYFQMYNGIISIFSNIEWYKKNFSMQPIIDFRFLGSKKNQLWLKNYHGRAVSDKLELNNSEVYYQDILEVFSHEKILVLILKPYTVLSDRLQNLVLPNHHALFLKCASNTLNIKRQIDFQNSITAYSNQKEKQKCVYCNCYNASQNSFLTFCKFCSTVYNNKLRKLTVFKDFDICSNCGYFEHLRPWDSFKLYYKEWYKTCQTCFNIYKSIGKTRYLKKRNPQKTSILRQKKTEKFNFEEFYQANYFARHAQTEKALEIYRKHEFSEASNLQKTLDTHPGIYYNKALAYLEQHDSQEAIACINRSIRLCSNYEPSHLLQKQLAFNTNNLKL